MASVYNWGQKKSLCQDFEGERALHVATVEGHTEIVLALLEHGANHLAKNSNDKTALDIARQAVAGRSAGLFAKVVFDIRFAF